jgi:hypothetical protein
MNRTIFAICFLSLHLLVAPLAAAKDPDISAVPTPTPTPLPQPVILADPQTPSKIKLDFKQDAGNKERDGKNILITGFKFPFNVPLSGPLVPSGEFKIPAIFEKLNTQLDVMQSYLKPDSLDESIYVPLKKQYVISASSTLCPQSDNPINKIPSATNTFLAPFEWNKAVGYTPMMNSFVGIGDSDPEEYTKLNELRPETRANKKTFGCVDPAIRKEVKSNIVPGSGDITFETTEENTPKFIEGSHWLGDFFTMLSKLPCLASICNSSFNPSLVNEFSTHVPELPRELADLNIDRNGANITGMFNRFRPDSIAPDNKNGETKDQSFKTSIANNSDVKGDVQFEGAGGLDEAQRRTECALTPDSMSTEERKNCVPDEGVLKSILGLLDIQGVRYPSDPGNNPLDYEIPFRNTNCQASTGLIDSIIPILSRMYPAYASLGTTVIRQYWQEIQSAAMRSNMNPLFALTLATEESAFFGAPGSYGMGCLFHETGRPTQTGASAGAIREQYACLLERQDSDFLGFMCRYSGEQRDGNNHCSSFSANPNFIHNVKFWYEQYSSGADSSCKIK